jgi:hypothetical protein
MQVHVELYQGIIRTYGREDILGDVIAHIVTHINSHATFSLLVSVALGEIRLN